MTLSTIYETIVSTVSSLTSQTYVLDRSPQKNFSEGFAGVYRYVRPAGVRKERITHGAPLTVITVEVGILALLRATPALMTEFEEEIDSLLNGLLSRAQLADNLIVSAADTQPSQEQILSTEGLDAEVQVVEAIANITIRGFYC